MKKIIGILSIATLLFSCTNDTLSIGDKTTMDVAQEIDMGDVVFGEDVVAKFKVTNTGDYPLILSEVKGSCSCTVADYSKEPILPGKSQWLKATIKTTNASAGVLRKDVRISANTTPAITSVMIKAKIIRK